MKKVTVFETNDGFLTKDETEAKEREESISFKKAIEEVLEQKGWSGMSKSDVVSIMIEKKQTFKDIFTGRKNA